MTKTVKLTPWEIAALEAVMRRNLAEADEWLNREQAKALLAKLEKAESGSLSYTPNAA